MATGLLGCILFILYKFEEEQVKPIFMRRKMRCCGFLAILSPPKNAQNANHKKIESANSKSAKMPHCERSAYLRNFFQVHKSVDLQFCRLIRRLPILLDTWPNQLMTKKHEHCFVLSWWRIVQYLLLFYYLKTKNCKGSLSHIINPNCQRLLFILNLYW